MYLTDASKEITKNVTKNVMTAKKIQKKYCNRKRSKYPHFIVRYKVLQKDVRFKTRA